MFKKGDIVVCIDNFVVSSYNEELHESKYLKLNKIYTIENPDAGSKDVKVEGIDYYYKRERFITVEKDRISKLNKIKKIYDEKTIRYRL